MTTRTESADRLTKALEVLVRKGADDSTVAEIAKASGYANESAFRFAVHHQPELEAAWRARSKRKVAARVAKLAHEKKLDAEAASKLKEIRTRLTRDLAGLSANQVTALLGELKEWERRRRRHARGK